MGPGEGALVRRPVPQTQALETQRCNWSLCRARFPYKRTLHQQAPTRQWSELKGLKTTAFLGKEAVRRPKSGGETITRAPQFGAWTHTARAQVTHSLTSTESTTHAPRKAHFLNSYSPTLHVGFQQNIVRRNKREKNENTNNAKRRNHHQNKTQL